MKCFQLSKKLWKLTSLIIIQAASSMPWERAFGDVTSTEPKFILMVYASGGWDQTMVFDPKIGSDYIDSPSNQSIATLSSGLQYVDHPSRSAVKTWFENYGANAVIVNGVYTPELDSKKSFGSHFTAVPKDKVRSVDFLTYHAATVRPSFLAPHIVFDAPFASGDFGYFTTKITKTRLAEYLSEDIPGTNRLTADDESNLLTLQKKTWWNQLDKLHQNSLDADKVRALYGNLTKEKQIGAKLRLINEKLGPQGGESNFLRYSKIALEMFANGSSLCATVQAGRNYYWDPSTAHLSKQSASFQLLFNELAMVMTHAQSLNLLDRLVIIVTSGTGKSPKLNDRGGKDPWPFTSVLLWGGIFRGGTVHGLTDGYLRGIPIDPIFGNIPSDTRTLIKMEHIFASIMFGAGGSYKSILPSIKALTSILSFEGEGSLR